MTGLSTDFIKRARLRIRDSMFTQELLRERHETVGRMDGRFLGVAFDPLSEDSDYDPQGAAVSSAFTAAFLDYLHGELAFGQGKTYCILNESIGAVWDFRHQVAGLPFP